jgi:hypothetical protein
MPSSCLTSLPCLWVELALAGCVLVGRTARCVSVGLTALGSGAGEPVLVSSLVGWREPWADGYSVSLFALASCRSAGQSIDACIGLDVACVGQC